MCRTSCRKRAALGRNLWDHTRLINSAPSQLTSCSARVWESTDLFAIRSAQIVSLTMTNRSELRHHDVLGNQSVYIKRTSAQSIYSRVRLHVSTMSLVIFRPLQFCYQMLCPLWDPIVFTVVEYALAKVSKKSL